MATKEQLNNNTLNTTPSLAPEIVSKLHESHASSSTTTQQSLSGKKASVPDTYQGESGLPWEDYLARFNVVAQWNGWDSKKRHLPYLWH